MILRGEILRGWLYNPLVYTALPIIVLHLLFRLITGLRIRYIFSLAGRTFSALGLSALIVANWMYEIFIIG